MAIFKKSSLKLIILLIFVVFCMSIGKVHAESSNTNINYYYNNSCSSCDDEGEFLKFAASKLSEYKNYRVNFYNGFNDNDSAFNQICGELGVDAKDRRYPMVVIGNGVLIGQNQIETDFAGLFRENISVQAGISTKQTTEQRYDLSALNVPDELKTANPGKPTIVFFYTPLCGDCEKVKVFLKELSEECELYSSKRNAAELDIISYNISELENIKLINAFFQVYEVPDNKKSVPIIFYANGYLSGYNEIIDMLSSVILDGSAMNFNVNRLQITNGIPKNPTIKDVIMLTGAGLINGLNPCSLSMLFLILSVLLSKKADILVLGFTFIGVKAIMFFLIGTVLYSFLSLLSSSVYNRISNILNIIIVAALLLLTFVNLLDFVAAKKEHYNKIRLQLPQILRALNNNLVSYFLDKNIKLVFLSVCLLGVFISIGEFLCTGQIYLGTIVYLIQNNKGSNLLEIFCLIYYIVVMSVPMTILTCYINKKKNVFSMSKLIKDKLPAIKLLNAGVFLLFALLILLT